MLKLKRSHTVSHHSQGVWASMRLHGKTYLWQHILVYPKMRRSSVNLLRYKITMAKGNAKLRAALLFAYLHVETNTVYDKY